MNIAVNIVNIVNIEWPHPNPSPVGRGVHAAELLSRNIGTGGNTVWYYRECCFQHVPTGGTICPNGWDDLSQWVGQSRSILFCASFDIISFLIPRPFPYGSSLSSEEGSGVGFLPPSLQGRAERGCRAFLCSLCSLLCSLRNLLILSA